MKYTQALILILGTIFFGFSQKIPDVISPSPNAASLGQYADIPVNNYTGIPSISIPLHSVKSNGVELPISISYHASGIKVGQEASWVGLGWALNAGGVITRQINGIDDFSTFGYVRTNKFPPYTEDNHPDSSEADQNNKYYNPIASRDLDSAPDVFYYNFLGYSGKIIFEKQPFVDTITGVSVEQNDLKFTYTISTRTWKIIDPYGVVYYFGGDLATEKTYNFNGSANGFSYDNVFISKPVHLNDTYYKDKFDSSWYISKVEKWGKEVFKFSYENLSNSLSQKRYSESKHNILDYHLVHSQGIDDFPPLISSSEEKFYNINEQAVGDLYLKQINFSNGKIIFNTEDRLDIKSFTDDSSTPQRLNSIDIQDSSNVFKKINLEYSYFNSNKIGESDQDNWLRLKLDNIYESFFELNKTVSLPPYEFNYNTIELPEKTSFSIDHWGYYNNRDNSRAIFNRILEIKNSSLSVWESLRPYYSNTLIPYLETSGEGKMYLNGANRDVNILVNQAAVLNSIKYPLGGFKKFTYETNDYYSDLIDEGFFEDEPQLFRVQDGGDEVPFFIEDYTVVSFEASIDNDDPNKRRFSQSDIKMSLINDTGKEIIKIIPFELEDDNFYTNFSVALPRGNYKLIANSEYDNYFLSFKAKFNKKKITNNKFGGGLRIKTILTEDDSKIVNTKKFKYDVNGLSTGRLLSPLKYYFNETLNNSNYISPAGGVVTYTVYLLDYLVRKSNSVVPLGSSAQGNSIGYDSVTIYNSSGLNNENTGFTEFVYHNEEEMLSGYFLPDMPNLLDFKNGQLLSRTLYNSDGEKISQSNYEYSEYRKSEINLKGVILYSSLLSSSNVLGGDNFSGKVRFYDIQSKWHYLTKETETLYNKEGNEPLTTVKKFEYNNPVHKNITKFTNIDSKNQIVEAKTYYPDDIVGKEVLEGGPLTEDEYNAIERLQKDAVEHRIGQPIQQETYVNNVLTSVQRTNFNTESGITLPASVSTALGSDDLEERLTYHSYTDNGNPEEVSQADGSHTSYIWGYNEEYPVVKVDNATIVAIEATLTASELEKVREGSYSESQMRSVLNKIRTGLPNSMVTTYTYDPLVGVTSITDPRGYTMYYEYDDFQRLEYVKDGDGNLLSKNEYNYKN